MNKKMYMLFNLFAAILWGIQLLICIVLGIKGTALFVIITAILTIYYLLLKDINSYTYILELKETIEKVKEIVKHNE